MDSDLWFARISAAKRALSSHDAAGSGSSHRLSFSGRGGAGGADEGVEADEAAAAQVEVPCPYCHEEHDIGSLCAHLEEDHLFESAAAVCPICSDKITRDMLNHIMLQHGHLFRSRRRLRRFLIPSGHALPLLSRDVRDAHLQALLGTSRSRGGTAANVSADSLLSSLVLNFPTSEAEEPPATSVSIPDDLCLAVTEPEPPAWKPSIDPTLSKEEKEQLRKRATVRASFVQSLVLSALFDS